MHRAGKVRSNFGEIRQTDRSTSGASIPTVLSIIMLDDSSNDSIEQQTSTRQLEGDPVSLVFSWCSVDRYQIAANVL